MTTTGFQRGAQRVADSYGIVILELRVPTERDMANRVVSVRIDLIARFPQVNDITAEAIEQFEDEARVPGTLGDCVLHFEDGTSERVMDHLLRGELGSLEEPPAAFHPVTRTFDPPAVLRNGEKPVARVVAIRATVGETREAPTTIQTTPADIRLDAGQHPDRQSHLVRQRRPDLGDP